MNATIEKPAFTILCPGWYNETNRPQPKNKRRIKFRGKVKRWVEPEREKPIERMRPGEIFRAGLVRKPSRKGRGPHTRIDDKIKIDKNFYRI